MHLGFSGSKVRSLSTAIQNIQSLTTLEYPNGTKVQPLFSTVEYENRVAKLRSQMLKDNIQATIFTSMHNVGYFSNFFYCAFGRSYAHVVTPEKSVTISALVDAGQPWRRTAIGENLVYTDWKKDNYLKAIKEALGPIEGKLAPLEFPKLANAQDCNFGHIKSSIFPPILLKVQLELKRTT